jgi:hypothetical protein
MPTVSESTKSSLAQKLTARARTAWPRLIRAANDSHSPRLRSSKGPWGSLESRMAMLRATPAISTQSDHLRSDRAELSPMPGARWLTEQNLLRDDDPAFSFAGLRALAGTMPVAIPELALSLSASQRRSFWEICREKPWESSGLAVGVLGLVL